MKKVLSLIAIAGMFAFVACGPSAEEKAKMEEINSKKARLIYDYIDSQDFYKNPVQPEDRSWMNVIFTLPSSISFPHIGHFIYISFYAQSEINRLIASLRSLSPL